MPDPTWLGSEFVDQPDQPDESAPSTPANEVKRLGDFRLIREIGRGGMGVVYEAEQVSLKRRVALKVLPPALTLSPNSIKRFAREAYAAAKLHHTNIVPVYAVGEEQGHHFYAMELVTGESLDGVLGGLRQGGPNPILGSRVEGSMGGGAVSGPATAGEPGTASVSETSTGGRGWFDAVARLTAEVADALEHAHGRGVIHRDIKPSNLMLSPDGKVLVTDFGLARLNEESSLTISGSFLGTPAYMSPEQIAAGRMKLDHRTDVYSLGAVLYELLTLQRAFGGESREEVVAGIMTKDPQPPRKLNPKIPVDLETICQKAMEKDPDRRYASAEALAQDLRKYLQRGLISARRAGPLRRLAKTVRRHPVAATIIISAAVLLTAGGGLIWRMVHLEQREAVRNAVSAAQSHLAAGLYREGLEEAESALDLDPDSATARLVRARLLMKLGRTREAVGEAESLLQRDPDDWTAHLVLASAAQELPWISAEEHIRVVETHAPESADAYYLRSVVAMSSADRLSLLNRALDLEPGHTGALLDRVRLYTDDFKDHPAALRDCELLIALRPRSAQGRRMRALVYADRQDFEQALAEIERAIEMDPQDAANLGAKALIHRSRGRHEEAIADLDRAIDLDPLAATFYEERAKAFNAAGRFEGARDDARRALDINPDGRSAYLELFHAFLRLDRKDQLREALDELKSAAENWADRQARAWAYRETAAQFRQLKDYDEALAASRRAIEIEPEEFRGYIYRAEIRKELGDRAGLDSDCDAAAAVELRDAIDLRQRGRDLGVVCERWESALDDHNRLVDRFPNWFRAHYQRGTTYLFLGRNEEALADLTRAIEMAPNWSRSYTGRAFVLWSLNRLEEYVADLNKAIELDPHEATSHYSNRAYANFHLGRIEEALRDYDKAIELDPLNADARANRGGQLAFLGQCDRAADDLHKAEEMGYTDPFVQQGLAWAHLNGLRRGCPSRYDPRAALRHSENAMKGFPEGADETYGHALHLNGRHAEAKAAMLKTYERKNGEGAWFMLSMCCWQLGERNEARRYYQRSAAWMDQHSPRDPVLIWQREDAARMLGLEP